MKLIADPEQSLPRMRSSVSRALDGGRREQLLGRLGYFDCSYPVICRWQRHSHIHANVGTVEVMPTGSGTCDLLCLDIPKAEAARAELPRIEQLNAWATAGKALADPTRLAVMHALASSQRACVCDLGWIVGRDEKLVSHHVRQLKAAGLARSQRAGRMVMYELTDQGRALLVALTGQVIRA